jgi:conjugative relaxase-like TrwC/TraI family protein
VLSVAAGADFRYYLDATAAPTENYYTGAVRAGEPDGRWAGRGAEALGLAGPVNAEQMEALYGHRIDPRDDRFAERSEWGEAATLGGPRRRYVSADEAYARALAAEPDASGERREQLRLDASRSARSNVEYLDVTFSVQKSVSVMHAAFDRSRVEAERADRPEEAQAWAAHRDAVEAAIWAGNAAALDYLQDEAGYSRVGHHGGAAGRFVDAHDWVVTSFFQHDSRDGDPQLHIHNPILNLAECADGKWRTLDSRGIHRHRAGAAALAERVTEEHLSRSLGVRFATRPDGKAREVVGMPAEANELFSSRRRAITPKTAELVAQFEARFNRAPSSLELDHIQRQATFATRQAKDHRGHETAEQRLDRWEAGIRASVAASLSGTAQNLLDRTDDREPAPEWSPTDVVEAALAEVQAARATWSRPDLTRAISSALPDYLGGLEAADVRELLIGLTDLALAHSDVAQVGGERDQDRPDVPELQLRSGASAYQGPASRTYALRSHVAGERALARAAVVLGAPAMSSHEAAAAVARTSRSGLVLGEDQSRVVAAILTSGARVETLVGPAGAGKSTVVGALARIWTDPATPWTGSDGCAPSTPGPSTLDHPAPGPGQQEPPRRVVGLAASQVATEVLAAEGLPARNVTRWLDTQQCLAAGAWRPEDAEWRLGAGDLVVIDEAAMLPTADLAAIHAHAHAAGAKLLLTGDHRQLAAVGAGGGMGLLAKAGGQELTEVRRFSDGWEGPASLRMREGDESVLHDYRQHGRLVDAGTLEQAHASAARAYLADILAGRHSVLVVGSNEDAARLSAEVRAELVRLGKVGESGVRLGMDGNTAGVDDLIQARHNAWNVAGWEGNPRAALNRDTYRVLGVRNDGGLWVELADGPAVGTVLALPAAYVAEHVTLGYAGTVHSTQGRTVDTSHVVAGAGTSAEALYVGMSRGRHGNHAHVITRPADDAQPIGAVHDTRRVDPLDVLTGVIRADDSTVDASRTATEQSENAEDRRRSVQTSIERLAAEAAEVYTARTAAALDQLAAAGALTPDQRQAFAADQPAHTALAGLLRTAELAGHNPADVLTAAVTERGFAGARSIPEVVHGRIRDALAGQLTPTADTYTDMVPAVERADWRDRLRQLAEAADTRRAELGAQAAQQAPAWAVENLGPVPTDPAARQAWQDRAGLVAAARELAGHDDLTTALGPPARAGQPEHYAAWHGAWTALGRPEAGHDETDLTDGQLRIRVRALQRETNWEPAYVGESVTAATLTADARRRDATLAAARAAATNDPAQAALYGREAAEAAALADVLDEQVRELQEADQARNAWLLHTAVTRDAGQRAQAELSDRIARGIATDPGSTVTAAEWLDAHRADQAAEDEHRPITEHDLADQHGATDEAVQRDVAELAASELAEARPVDVRDTTAAEIADETGRIPTAAQTRDAVLHAQAALAEIEARRALDAARAADEHRAHQLNQWAADDQIAEHALAAEQSAEHTYG